MAACVVDCIARDCNTSAWVNKDTNAVSLINCVSSHSCIVAARDIDTVFANAEDFVFLNKGAFATFNLAAIIREWGFRATRAQQVDGARLAAAAGLGNLDRGGRLVTPQFGAKVHVADVILTDLPVQPDR